MGQASENRCPMSVPCHVPWSRLSVMGHRMGHGRDTCFAVHVPFQAIDVIEKSILWDTWDTIFAVPYI
jgi:hypothetical protein